MHFEDAIAIVMSGGRARRACWARVADYTRTTPPINYERAWHIWQADTGEIVNGWGGLAELTLLAAGAPVIVRILGSRHPPIAVAVGEPPG